MKTSIDKAPKGSKGRKTSVEKFEKPSHDYRGVLDSRVSNKDRIQSAK